MIIVTSNIKSNPTMRQADVESDVQAVADWAVNSSIEETVAICWQEIIPERYKRAVAALQGWKHFCLDTEDPISILPVRWKAGGAVTRLMHKGIPLVEPNRYATMAPLTAGTRKVAIMNTHYVSGAWNDKRRFMKTRRKELWNQHWAEQHAWIESLRQRGYVVIASGDYNRAIVPAFDRRQTVLAAHGIDKILGVPSVDWQPSLIGADSLPGLHTDHKAVLARVGISRVGN